MCSVIREGQATIDPRRVLECAVLLDHGRLLALPIYEHPHMAYSSCGISPGHTKMR